VTRRENHPDDTALLAWAGGQEDTSVAAHVSSCGSCRQRTSAWRDSLGALRLDLAGEADAHFAEDRLARQRAEISRRLRGAPRARVLAFPAAHVSGARPSTAFSPEARRWVAAAALVGLVLGGATGWILDRRRPFPMREGGTAAGVDAGAARVPTLLHLESATADEAFIVELDAALMTRGPGPLRALDAITPDLEPSSRPR
jgi:hypothetical protein